MRGRKTSKLQFQLAKPGERGADCFEGLVSLNSLTEEMSYSPFSSMALEAVMSVLELALDNSSKSPELSSYGEVEQDKKLPSYTHFHIITSKIIPSLFVGHFFLKSNSFAAWQTIQKDSNSEGRKNTR